MTPRVSNRFRNRAQDIKVLCAARFKVSVEAIVGKGKSHKVAQARHVAIFLTREMTDLSFPGVARHFGGRCHSTMMYACRRIAWETGENPYLEKMVNSLRTSLLLKWCDDASQAAHG